VTLLLLFAEFFKVGLFSVGGGLATLPFLYQLADNYGWFTHETIANMVAVAESTPGAIGVNMATYAGFQYAGVPGSVTATLGLIMPSIIVIIIVTRILSAFKESSLAVSVFSGLRPAAAGLVAAAGFGVMKLSLYNGEAPVWYGLLRWREGAVFAALFFFIHVFRKHPVVYIAAAGLAGVVLGL
jgi:chromate transporter